MRIPIYLRGERVASNHFIKVQGARDNLKGPVHCAHLREDMFQVDILNDHFIKAVQVSEIEDDPEAIIFGDEEVIAVKP